MNEFVRSELLKQTLALLQATEASTPAPPPRSSNGLMVIKTLDPDAPLAIVAHPDWCSKCAKDDAKLRGVEYGDGYVQSPYHWNAH